MAYEPKIKVALPPATLAFTYLYVADTEAPEGSNFKADGKFKATAVYSDRTLLAKAEGVVLAALKAKFPDVDPEEFVTPFKTLPDDFRKEELRGKTIVKVARVPPPDCRRGRRDNLHGASGPGRRVQR